MQQSTPYLSFRGIGKTFPGVKALTDISFDCYAGQVHALMGENGAGKSTLLKILSGNYAPTTGSLTIRGQEVSFADTTAALNSKRRHYLSGTASRPGNDRCREYLFRAVTAQRRDCEPLAAEL